jgi:hypothetical protein
VKLQHDAAHNWTNHVTRQLDMIENIALLFRVLTFVRWIQGCQMFFLAEHAKTKKNVCIPMANN